MEYPVLHWTSWGGGLLIALVATIHVFIAHFAVGGGLFIAIMETRVQRLGLVAMKDYLRRYARFFLHLTMVVGGLTGVGIWFTISVLSPAATSVLISAFAFGWATEWTFFLAEVVALLAYMGSFEGAKSTRRLILAWLYFVFAFGSLAVVQGFVSFMLTPGDWLETRRFWDGFFNPTYFPGLAFRCAMAASIAGVFGLLTAQGVESAPERRRLARFCSLWAVLPLPVAVAAGWWHIEMLHPAQQAMVLHRSPEVAAGMRAFWWAVPAVLTGGALLALGLPRRAARVMAAATLAASFLFLGSFEFMRESARRPYLISGLLYSNGIPVTEAASLNKMGVLPQARWTRHKMATAENRLEAGRELFYLQCASCHSIGGPMLDIVPRAARFSPAGMDALLSGLGKVSGYMPPFLGVRAERAALAAWLTEGLSPQRRAARPAPGNVVPAHEPPLPFREDAEYLLTAAADFAMHPRFDGKGIDLGGPPQGLTAQLIRRGPSPEVVTEGATLSWTVADQGGGNMTAAGGAFRAEGLNLSPYGRADAFQPYPVALVQAHDQSGTLLAQTKAVLPVSTELGCNNCHGGGWSHGVAGIDDATAQDILRRHDRAHDTALAAQARRGQTVSCRACHQDDDARNKTAASLSAAMHGLHAVYLSGREGDACAMCHPVDPGGATRAFRGPHQAAGLDCTACHGAMEDHALSLLAHEQAREQAREQVRGAQGRGRAAAHLKATRDPVPPRRAWSNAPTCQTCHEDLQDPAQADAFGVWTKGPDEAYRVRKDDLGAVRCSGCHGPMHALYPAVNPYDPERDNLQPLQHQQLARPLGGEGRCSSCHTMDMDAPVHHPGMGLP